MSLMLVVVVRVVDHQVLNVVVSCQHSGRDSRFVNQGKHEQKKRDQHERLEKMNVGGYQRVGRSWLVMVGRVVAVESILVFARRTLMKQQWVRIPRATIVFDFLEPFGASDQHIVGIPCVVFRRSRHDHGNEKTTKNQNFQMHFRTSTALTCKRCSTLYAAKRRWKSFVLAKLFRPMLMMTGFRQFRSDDKFFYDSKNFFSLFSFYHCRTVLTTH